MSVHQQHLLLLTVTRRQLAPILLTDDDAAVPVVFNVIIILRVCVCERESVHVKCIPMLSDELIREFNVVYMM